MSRADKLEALALLEEKEVRASRRACISLHEFVRQAWHVVEPGQAYVDNWHIDCLCDHLEAAYVSEGEASGDEIVPAMAQKWGSTELFRILGNVPPGTMKSLLVSVFFPAWVWGPMGKPHKRFLATSHSEKLSIRDTLKCRRLVKSKWFQRRWRIEIAADQDTKGKFENSATGFRQGAPFKSLTGERADFVILDDPMSVADALSDADRESANITFRESLTTRLNNPAWSVIIVIMQRLHQDDTSGVILSDPDRMGYEHIMLPMRFDPERRCQTSIGFVDPRQDDGELLFPDRFPIATVNRLETDLGPIATAGQHQQTPKVRGGQILKREYWEPWQGKYPSFEWIIVSADTAYTKNEENDPSACTVWGIFRDKNDRTRMMLLWGWQKHLELHGQMPERLPQEAQSAYDRRCMPHFGLVEWLGYTARYYQADIVLIEAKASGKSVVQEMRRLYRGSRWKVVEASPTHDKIARAHEAEPCFAAGLIYAPTDKDGFSEEWSEQVIEQCETFPRSKFKDLVDSTSQAVTFARKRRYLVHDHEAAAADLAAGEHRAAPRPLYEA